MKSNKLLSTLTIICLLGISGLGFSQSAPQLTVTHPESWGILNACDNLRLYFNEPVNEVAGKSIVIYSAADDTPIMTFTLPNASVTGSGTDSIYVDLGSNLPQGNYYVNIDPGAYKNQYGVDFAGITNKETWKITIFTAGVINDNTTWSGNLAIYTDITLYATLTIDPGANVKFMGHYFLENTGVIHALGNINDSIHFFADNPSSGWKGIRSVIGGNATIQYCHFADGNAKEGNNYQGWGGAIVTNSNWTIENSTFANNHADNEGGAISCIGNEPIIRNNAFIGNTSEWGGAISAHNGANPKIYNNLFVNNSASENGGAITFVEQSNGTVFNNTFTQNSSVVGGAVSCIFGSSPEFKNCIFYNNQASQAGNEINLVYWDYAVGVPDFYYCLIEGGEAGINGGFTGQYINNIDNNPKFIGGGVYRLMPYSPCINSGDSSTTVADVGNKDLSDGPRFLDSIIDIGAYETRRIFQDTAGTNLHFDGSSHYVNVSNSPKINLTDDFTIEAWIKPSSFNWLAGIVSKYHSSGADGYTLRLTSSAPYTGIEFNGQSTPTDMLASDQWYHIAAVRQSGSNYIYINGIKQPLTAASSSVVQNSDPLCIGVDFLASPRFFDGLIDEVRIWNSTRTAKEIRENMNLALPGTTSGLASYWQFNAGTGTIAIDQTGFNDGTLNNMDNADWISSTIPFGAGSSNTQFVSSTGTLDFPGTKVNMEFVEKTGTDTIVVSSIEDSPRLIPDDCKDVFNEQYWVISKYGPGQLSATVNFTISETLTLNDENNPHLIKLFKRANNSSSEWQRYKVATMVNASTKTVTFEEIDEFGQFILARQTDTIPPYVASTYPEYWCISHSLDSLKFEFNETVEEVAGKSIVIYNAFNHTPERTITLPSAEVTGSGSNSITVQLNPALSFGEFYVTVDSGAFKDHSLNDFQGVTDENTWKVSNLENGLFESDNTWSGNMALYTRVVIMQDNSLTISPGSHLKFMGSHEIYNYGTFLAEGTEIDSIHFYPNDTVTDRFRLRLESESKVKYCSFKNGKALQGNDGGAVYIYALNVQLENCTFINNYAEGNGGALHVNGSDALVRNNIFKNNRSSKSGGAISLFNFSTPKIENNLFINNNAVEDGGGVIVMQNSSPRFYNNTFSQNSAAHGGAISCINGSSVDIYNCILYNNTATHGGHEVSLVHSTDPPGIPNFYYCNIEGGKEAIEGTYTGTYEKNMDVDPEFIGYGDHPYALLKSSACVNAGDPTTTATDVGNTDLAGGPRFLHGQIDMGAYETLMVPDAFAGTALDFDGVDDYVDCGNDESLDIIDAITVEAWVKRSAVSHNNYILQKDDIHWLFWDNSFESVSGQGIQIKLPGPNTGWWEFQYNMENDKWYHIAWTYDSSNGELTAYINGEIVRQGYFTGNLSTNTQSLKISPAISSQSYEGLLDEIRVWDVVRTRKEIRENMYLTFPENKPGLVSYWQFNSGEGNHLADLMGVNRGELHHMDNSDWVKSTIPFADGMSNTQLISTTGNRGFPNTGIEMGFLQKSGTDTLTVSRLDTLPNILPKGGEAVPNNNYWVINSFGSGSCLADLNFTLETDLTAYDELNPGNLILFNRENTSDTSWVLLRKAALVNANTNTVTFDSINSFGQFIITKNEFDYYPGYAIECDTTSSYVELSHENHFEFDTAFTIETWLYTNRMTTDYHTILSKGNAWQLRMVYSDDAIMLEYSINLGPEELAVTFITDTATMLNKWSHISCVYHHAPPQSYINMYLNGVEGTSAPAATLVADNTPVRIGESFKGKVDELRFWNTVRSTQQIREGMNLTLEYPFAGLLSYLQLNEGSGTIAKDVYGGNYGSLINMDWPAGWVNSSIPFGGGNSNTQAENYGVIEFTETGLSLNYELETGASVTVAKIDTTPNDFPTGIGDIFDQQYWVVHRFGSGSFLADFTFTVDEYLSEDDEVNPGQIKLFNRSSNSSGLWVEIASASTVDHLANQITFEDIDETGQFILGRKKLFSGYPGYALHFDGENDYISGSGIDTNLSAFTLEAWVKHDTLPPHVQRYITLGPETAVLRYDGTIYGGYRELHFYIKKASGHHVGIRVDSILTKGRWMHVAGTYDGVSMKLFLNGELLQSISPESALYDLDGNFAFSSATEAMNGQMDEFRIWNVARSEAQIRESMHRVLDHSVEGLINYWQFNEGEGLVALDTMSGQQGNMHNMTPATCWNESTIPAGMGFSNTQWVESRGTIDFTSTDLKMDFISKSGSDSVVATKINISPNSQPSDQYQVLDDQYWVINSFGSGDFTTDITFKVSENLLTSDEVFPSTIKLFSRNSNSDSSWILIDSAQSVSTANQTATFSGIDHFSQFLIARGENHILPPGNCLYFDGVDDYVSIPPNATLNDNTFTVEFWISTSEPDSWMGIIDKGRNSGSDWYFLTGATGSTEGVVYGVSDGSIPGTEVAYSWNNENWHHVAGTFDGASMRLYVDGEFVTSKTTTMDNTGNGISFGSRLSGGSNFQGLLDEIRIWDVARSEEQLRENMHKPLIGNETNLVSYWRFDETSDTIAHDFAGSNNGVLHNMNIQWKGSTAPVPYFTMANGNWETPGTWAAGQNSPDHSWARVRLDHQIDLNSNLEIMELIINSAGVLTVLSGFTLTISP